MKIGLFAILMLFAFLSVGQNATSVQDSSALKEALITSEQGAWKRPESSLIDSTIMNTFSTSTMGDLLRMGQALHVKSYGNTGLATVAYRGLDATALNVVWKGVKLNSSLNGMLDLSIVPVFFFDQAEFYSNTVNSSALSGSIGADLVLRNTNHETNYDLESNLDLEGSFGSFGKGFGGVKYLEIKGDRDFVFDMRLYYSEARNDYEYKPLAFPRIGEVLTLENAESKSFGIMVGGEHANQEGTTEVSIMLNLNERNLPATLLEASSVKQQNDLYGVWLFNRLWRMKNSSIGWNNSFTNQQQSYSDSNANIETNLTTNIYQNSLEYNRVISEYFVIASGLSSYYAEAETGNYSKLRAQHFFGQNTSVKYVKKDWRLQVAIKSLLAKEKDLWFMPVVSASKTFNNKVKIHGLMERSGRLPTLNELHWQPGGRSDLKPISSYKYELGLNAQNDGWNFSHILYLNDMTRYIEWLPDGGSFAVVQHRFVRAAGAESMLSYLRSGPNWLLKMNFTYNHTRSVYGHDLHYNNQRILVPINTGSFGLRFGRKNLQLEYLHSFTSERYLDTDHSSSVDPYMLGDFNLVYKVKGLTIRAIARNVWGQEYYVLPYRPMPYRNFEFGIKYQFKRQINIPKE